MGRLTKISDSEYEVMEVLWEDKDWMEIAKIHESLSKARKWAYNTVGTFLIRLSKKGFVESKKSGRTNLYKAMVTKDEYVDYQTGEFLKSVYKGSKKNLIAALYNEENTSDQEIEELIDWVERRRK